jgi:hypothetical protein
VKHKSGQTDVNRVATTDYDDEGFLQAQLEPIGHEAGGSALPSELMHPFGFQGRPNDADQDVDGSITDGALAFEYTEGNSKALIACDDGRVALPPLGKGGSRHYDAAGARQDLDGQGNLTIFVPKGTNQIIFTGPGAGNIQIGGTSQLALGAALNQALQMIVTLMGTPAVSGSPPQTPAQIAAFQAAVTKYQTSILVGG